MKVLFIVFVFFTFGFGACKPIKYESDNTSEFISSGMADSPEYPVKINGEWCKNLKGEVGGCYMRVKENEKTIIEILPQLYAYTFKMFCSDKIDFHEYENGINIPSETALVIEISDYKKQNSFICTGRIYPDDREEPISSFFEVRMRIVDEKYFGRETIHHTGGYQIFGKYSKYVMYLKNGKWIKKEELTAVKTDQPYITISESHKQRISTYGI